MADVTGISWTHHTWNPVWGCHKISPGCKHCYMFEQMKRYGRDPDAPQRTKTWSDPYRWERRARETGLPELVFTCSLSDWFIEETDQWRDDLWAIVHDCPHLIFQILTKRPQRIRDHLPANWGDGYGNVWLGTSVERADYLGRVDVLRQVPAQVRFISAEPLLGPLSELDLTDVQWLIVGGETGPEYRPMDHAWARELRDMAVDAGTAYFFKQSSGRLPGRGDQLDGLEWKQFPEIPPGAQTDANWVAFRARRNKEVRQARDDSGSDEESSDEHRQETNRPEEGPSRTKAEAPTGEVPQREAEESIRAHTPRTEEWSRRAREEVERHRARQAEELQRREEAERRRKVEWEETLRNFDRLSEEFRRTTEQTAEWARQLLEVIRGSRGYDRMFLYAPRETFAVLGLTWPCTRADLRGAYRAAAKRTHPDRCNGDSTEFLKVQAAYEKLSKAFDLLEKSVAPRPACRRNLLQLGRGRPTS